MFRILHNAYRWWKCFRHPGLKFFAGHFWYRQFFIVRQGSPLYSIHPYNPLNRSVAYGDSIADCIYKINQIQDYVHRDDWIHPEDLKKR